jgi:hypothetical protein
MPNELAIIDDRGLVLDTRDKLEAACLSITQSGMCPKQFQNKPKDALIAVLAGMAVGWKPLQSLQAIAVINGRPSIYGDGLTGLAYGSGKVAWVREWMELDGKVVDHPSYATPKDYPNGLTACWQAQRKDCEEPSPVARFSVGDAKAANLWLKQGPWTQYPMRMLTMRARSWGLRDNFSDALQGLVQAEELMDIQPTHTPSRLEQIAAKQLPAPEGEATIDAEPEAAADAPQLVTPEWCKKFRAGIATKRKSLETSLGNDEFIQIVVRDFVGTEEDLCELIPKQADELAASLKAGDYCWETGERIPPAADSEPMPTGDTIPY